MSEQFEFDQLNGYNITKAISNFSIYSIPKDAIYIADGTENDYAFIEVAKQSKTFELKFEEDSKLEYIGNYAFYKCSQLTNIDFTNAINLKYIGGFSFCECTKLESLDFTNAPKFEGFPKYGAFHGCTMLSSVIFPDNSKVRTIDGGTFRNTAIKSFRVPKECSSITGEAFGFCKIDNFTVESGNIYYSEYKGSLFSADNKILVCYRYSNPILELPNETTTIDWLAFEGYPHSLLIPKQITDYSEKAFFGYYGRTLSFMNPPHNLNSELFRGCHELRSIYFFDYVSTIQQNAFQECSALKYVYFILPVDEIHIKSFPNPEKICFAGAVDSVRKCLSDVSIRECELTIKDNFTCYRRTRSLNLIPFIYILIVQSKKVQ